MQLNKWVQEEILPTLDVLDSHQLHIRCFMFCVGFFKESYQ